MNDGNHETGLIILNLVIGASVRNGTNVEHAYPVPRETGTHLEGCPSGGGCRSLPLGTDHPKGSPFPRYAVIHEIQNNDPGRRRERKDERDSLTGRNRPSNTARAPVFPGPAPFAQERQGAGVVSTTASGQFSATESRAARSTSSTVSPQRVFTVVHSVT